MTKKTKKQRRAAKSAARRANNVRALRYEAVEARPTRRPIYLSSKSEDGELTPAKRRALISEARDQIRNFSLAGFALRKHLQFVSYYRFNARTDDAAFNRRLERLVARWSLAENCDAARRRSLPELLTLIESHRAIDGDVGILRRSDNRLQIVEADRIQTPPDERGDVDGPTTWVHGVRTSSIGRALSFGIMRRKENGGFDFERTVSARDFDLLTYVTRADQVRGVSLFAPAVKMISYLYDGLDYALAKLKLEQLLGLKTTFEDGGNLTIPGQPGTDDPDSVASKASEFFGGDLMHIALKVGEDAQFMESNNPSQNFQNFCESVVRMIFAALDIPYSFYDGSKTNFYGSRGEFEQYLDSVEKKQQPTRALLDKWLFDWLLPNWIADGEVELPPGWELDDLRGRVAWSGAGYPSWRLFEYVKEITIAIQGGLLSPATIAESFGEDVDKNVEELARLRALAARLDVALPYGEQQAQNLGL